MKTSTCPLLLLRLVQSGRFTQIKHYYLIPGHSFLPCDQDFGNLERTFQGLDIYATPHYITLMKDARDTNPFNVVEMTCNDFYDLKPLQALCTKASLACARFKEGRLFEYKESYKQGMGIMNSYVQDEPKKVKLQKGKGMDYNPRSSTYLVSTCLLTTTTASSCNLKSWLTCNTSLGLCLQSTYRSTTTSSRLWGC